MRKAKAQKRSLPSCRYRALRRIDVEFEPRRDEECDTRHHAMARSRGADVHIAVVRVPNETVPATFELAIKRVQHEFDSNGESGPPCGVPSSVALTKPFSNTPAFKNARASFSTRVSVTR
jgi:hypothetical protein